MGWIHYSCLSNVTHVSVVMNGLLFCIVTDTIGAAQTQMMEFNGPHVQDGTMMVGAGPVIPGLLLDTLISDIFDKISSNIKNSFKLNIYGISLLLLQGYRSKTFYEPIESRSLCDIFL